MSVNGVWIDDWSLDWGFIIVRNVYVGFVVGFSRVVCWRRWSVRSWVCVWVIVVVINGVGFLDNDSMVGGYGGYEYEGFWMK